MIFSNKKLVAIFAILLTVLVIIGITVGIFTSQQNGSQIAIGNYDKYVKSLPQDRRAAINKALYGVIKSGLQNKKINVDDAIIREGSYTEVFNSSEKTYSSTFIVDIASIKQSYKVLFTWSKDAKIVLRGDNLKFDCLSKDQLIYGDFKCSEILGLPTSSNDPILQYLPYSTFNYTIALSPVANEKVGLDIRIFLYSSDTRDGNRDQSIDRYKNEAINWIKSKGLDVNNYLITYTID
jgi:hypothetical protein